MVQYGIWLIMCQRQRTIFIFVTISRHDRNLQSFMQNKCWLVTFPKVATNVCFRHAMLYVVWIWWSKDVAASPVPKRKYSCSQTDERDTKSVDLKLVSQFTFSQTDERDTKSVDLKLVSQSSCSQTDERDTKSVDLKLVSQSTFSQTDERDTKYVDLKLVSQSSCSQTDERDTKSVDLKLVSQSSCSHTDERDTKSVGLKLVSQSSCSQTDERDTKSVDLKLVSQSSCSQTDERQGRRRRGGSRGGGARASPLSKVGGGTSGFVPPTFGQSKCSNFTICSYFVVKNTFFQNFLGLLRSPTLINQYFLNFANLKL